MQTPPDPPQTRSEVLTDGDAEAGSPVTRRPRPKLALTVIGVWTVTFIAVGTWATYWADLRNDDA